MTPPHDEWTYFSRVTLASGKSGAKCPKCTDPLAKCDKKFLQKHR